MANRIANPIYDSIIANPDVRHMMDVEDEILGELEGLDTQIARQKKQLKEKEEQLSQKDDEIRRLKEMLKSMNK